MNYTIVLMLLFFAAGIATLFKARFSWALTFLMLTFLIGMGAYQALLYERGELLEKLNTTITTTITTTTTTYDPTLNQTITNTITETITTWTLKTGDPRWQAHLQTTTLTYTIWVITGLTIIFTLTYVMVKTWIESWEKKEGLKIS